jgi:hypothetical protein
MSTAYAFGLTLPLMILEHLLCVMWQKLWLLWWSAGRCAHQTWVSFSFGSSFTIFFVTLRLSIACYTRHWPRIAPRQSQPRDSENGSQHTSLALSSKQPSPLLSRGTLSGRLLLHTCQHLHSRSEYLNASNSSYTSPRHEARTEAESPSE